MKGDKKSLIHTWDFGFDIRIFLIIHPFFARRLSCFLSEGKLQKRQKKAHGGPMGGHAISLCEHSCGYVTICYYFQRWAYVLHTHYTLKKNLRNAWRRGAAAKGHFFYFFCLGSSTSNQQQRGSSGPPGRWRIHGLSPTDTTEMMLIDLGKLQKILNLKI